MSLGGLGWADTVRVAVGNPLDDERKFIAYYGIRPLWYVLTPSLFQCRPCQGTGGDEFKGRCEECRGAGLVKARAA